MYFLNYCRLVIDNDSYARFQSEDIKEIFVKLYIKSFSPIKIN